MVGNKLSRSWVVQSYIYNVYVRMHASLMPTVCNFLFLHDFIRTMLYAIGVLSSIHTFLSCRTIFQCLLYFYKHNYKKCLNHQNHQNNIYPQEVVIFLKYVIVLWVRMKENKYILMFTNFNLKKAYLRCFVWRYLFFCMHVKILGASYDLHWHEGEFIFVNLTAALKSPTS
jgi:hypothetical protein